MGNVVEVDDDGAGYWAERRRGQLCRQALQGNVYQLVGIGGTVQANVIPFGLYDRQVPYFEQSCARLGTGRQVAGGAGPSRSEERRVGNECVRTCRSRWSPVHSNK